MVAGKVQRIEGTLNFPAEDVWPLGDISLEVGSIGLQRGARSPMTSTKMPFLSTGRPAAPPALPRRLRRPGGIAAKTGDARRRRAARANRPQRRTPQGASRLYPRRRSPGW